MTNRASPVCNQVPRDSCKTSGPIPRPPRPDQTAKQPRNRPDKHPSTAPRSAIQCHFLLVRLGQDTGAARPAGRLIKRQAAQTSTPARFVPPRRIDDGTHSGPHTPAGNPLRAKRPVRARRPAALRQRVLNSDLQRRPPARWGGRLRRLPGAGRRGPEEPRLVPQRLPSARLSAILIRSLGSMPVFSPTPSTRISLRMNAWEFRGIRVFPTETTGGRIASGSMWDPVELGLRRRQCTRGIVAVVVDAGYDDNRVEYERVVEPFGKHFSDDVFDLSGGLLGRRHLLSNRGGVWLWTRG